MARLKGIHKDSLIGVSSILIYLIVSISKISFLINIFGLILIIWVPGSLFIRMLYPKDRQLRLVERVILSTTCSFCLVPLVGILLDKFWVVNQQTILGSIILVSWIFILIAYFRSK